jgi:hypothetical protein
MLYRKPQMVLYRYSTILGCIVKSIFRYVYRYNISLAPMCFTICMFHDMLTDT